MAIPDSPSVPSAPAIQGLTFRFFASPDDYVATAAVRQASAAHDGIDPQSSRESLPTADDMRGMFAEAATSQRPDLLLVTMHDQVIGYNHVVWRWTR